ncbi:MAG: DUF4390 domain-containing protein [Woeseiaceae bacterium]
MRGTKTFGFAAIVLTFWVGMLAPGPATAQQIPERQGFFDIRSASTLLNEGVHELEARLQLILSDDALEALNSGVPLTIELEFEVIRVRGLWLDAHDAALSFNYELEYRPLSQRYIVRSLNSGDQDSFATLYSALNNLGRIQGLPVIDDAVLEQDGRYRLRLRARLSSRQYPASLRLLFFWRSQWQLVSDWYEWTLAR